MPLPKGKKKTKRERRRFGSFGDSTIVDGTPAAPQKPKSWGARPIRKGGFQLPLWANALVGIAMLLFGVVWYFTSGGANRLVFLLLYCLVAGIYLFKAVQQYRAKRGS